MQRKLAELIVEVEAAQALVFDGYLGPRLRIGAPLIKLRAARLGITAASDAIEIHGGNGYIEQWPVARILRDAQVNTVWEGPDNILCLDVRRAIERDGADAAVPRPPARGRRAGRRAATRRRPTLVARADRRPRSRPSTRWQALDRTTAEARLYPLAQFMVDVYAAALLLEQAGWEQARARLRPQGSSSPGSTSATHLADPGPLRGIDAPAEELRAVQGPLRRRLRRRAGRVAKRRQGESVRADRPCVRS